MKKLLLLAVIYSTSSFGKDCAVACGNGFDSCSLVGVIEIEKPFDELQQAYIAKVISIKYPDFSKSFKLINDGINEDGVFINERVVKMNAPKEIILVEHGIWSVDEFMPITITSHAPSLDMIYEVGRKYYFFGRKIRDNIYETTRASCTVPIK